YGVILAHSLLVFIPWERCDIMSIFVLFDGVCIRFPAIRKWHIF
ncbi:Uncharacterized protein APZ42_010227, partial [Daphnia magna]